MSDAVTKHPILLSSDVKDKLEPVLRALEQVLGSSTDVVEVVGSTPSLLSMALGTIASNVQVMRDMGLSDADIQASVKKAPQLFGFDYTSEDFQAKLRYYPEVLGRSARHMLLAEPALLKYRLRRIALRVRVLSTPRFATALTTVVSARVTVQLPSYP